MMNYARGRSDLFLFLQPGNTENKYVHLPAIISFGAKFKAHQRLLLQRWEFIKEKKKVRKKERRNHALDQENAQEKKNVLRLKI